MYHACDSHGYCIYDYNTLQLSDFYASVLSVWFTLVTMIKMRSLWHRTLNIVALLCLFIGVQLARFGVLVIAVPGGIGLLFVLLSFVSTGFLFSHFILVLRIAHCLISSRCSLTKLFLLFRRTDVASVENAFQVQKGTSWF